MRKHILAFILLLCIAVPCRAQAIREDVLQYAPFGTVHVLRKTDKPTNIILFVSGDGGWDKGFVDLMHSVAKLDALVASVDITHYLPEIGKRKASCAYSAADLEGFSQFLQTKYDYTTYTPPVLVGYSSGATLVYGALLQGPPNTFSGAISMGFCPDLESPKPLCKGTALTYTADSKNKNTYIYGKATAMPAPWMVIQGDDDQVCDAPHAKIFVDGIANASVISLPKVGHGFAVEENWLPQFTAYFQSIVDQRKKAEAAIKKPESLADLPLVENAVSAPNGKPLALIVTGDGGWAGIDRDIGGALNAKDINVVGLNSLQYFWSAKSPEQSTKDLSRILAWYQAEWKPSSIMLIGYSLGADVLPFMYNRLPAQQKTTIKTIALLGIEKRASFSFHVSDWLGSGSGNDDLPIKPETDRFANVNSLCFYGTDEVADSLCPTLDPTKFTIVKTKGGHHFGGDYNTLAQQILQVDK